MECLLVKSYDVVVVNIVHRRIHRLFPRRSSFVFTRKHSFESIYVCRDMFEHRYYIFIANQFINDYFHPVLKGYITYACMLPYLKETLF